MRQLARTAAGLTAVLVAAMGCGWLAKAVPVPDDQLELWPERAHPAPVDLVDPVGWRLSRLDSQIVCSGLARIREARSVDSLPLPTESFRLRTRTWQSSDLAFEVRCEEKWANGKGSIPGYSPKHPELLQEQAVFSIDPSQSLRSVTQIRRNPIVPFVELTFLNSADQWIVYDGLLAGQPYWASVETGTARWPDGSLTSHSRARLACKVRVDGVGPCDLRLYLQ